MSRQLWSAVDKVTPRAARAYVKAVQRVKARCPLVDLANALTDGDVRRAEHVLTRLGIEDTMVPLSNIARDMYAKGGKVAHEEG